MARLTVALGPDAAGTLLAALVEKGRGALDIAVYEMGPSFAPLVAAAARRRPVRVLLDDHEQGNARTLPILLRAGVAVRVAGGPLLGRAHWKLLRSGTTVACGTGNLEERDAPVDPHGVMPCTPPRAGTREWWSTVSASPAVLRAASALFDEHWRRSPDAVLRRSVAGAEPRGAAGRPAEETPAVGMPAELVAPLRLTVTDRAVRLVAGGEAAAREVERLVSAARRRILVTVPYVHGHAPPVSALLAALGRAAARGVDVRLLLGQTPSPGEVPALRAAGFAVRVMDPSRCTAGHAKGVVADSRVLVGSANWSAAGLGGRLEASLRIDSAPAAGYLADAHARDWEVSTDLD